MITVPSGRTMDMVQHNENTELVRQIYRDFVEGNVEAVLDVFHPDIDWSSHVNWPGGPTPLPYEGACRGRDEVAARFEMFNRLVRYEKTVDRTRFFTDGNRVLATGHDIRREMTTGNLTENRWSMLWTFKNGQAVHIRIYQDTVDWLD